MPLFKKMNKMFLLDTKQKHKGLILHLEIPHLGKKGNLQLIDIYETVMNLFAFFADYFSFYLLIILIYIY